MVRVGLDATYFELGTRDQPIVHSHAVHEGVSPQISEFTLLCKAKDCKGMVRTFAEVRIALSVNVGKQILLALFFIEPEIAHSAEERDQGFTELSAYERLFKHPSEEVAGNYMVIKGIFSAQVSRSRNVEFVLHIW